MARCKNCQKELPFKSALKYLFKGKRDPAKSSFTCVVCGKVSVLPAGTFTAGAFFVFFTSMGTSLLVLKSFTPHGRPSDLAFVIVLLVSCALWYFVWWKKIARLKPSNAGPHTGPP